MKLIQLPIKKSKSQIKEKPIQGNICFNWSDVEIVECSKNGNGVLHFRSGREYTSDTGFEAMREKFLKTRGNK